MAEVAGVLWSHPGTAKWGDDHKRSSQLSSQASDTVVASCAPSKPLVLGCYANIAPPSSPAPASTSTDCAVLLGEPSPDSS